MGIDIYKKIATTETIIDKVICPLDNNDITDMYPYCCMYEDCSWVKKDKYYELNGKKYRCPLERSRIEEYEFERNKLIYKRKKYIEAYEKANIITYSELSSICAKYKTQIEEDIMDYKNLIVNPYLEENEKFVVFKHSEGNIIGASATETLLLKLYNIFKEAPDISVSIIKVNKEIADSLIIYFGLSYKFDIIRQIKLSDPVFLKKTEIYKYANNVFGLSYPTIRKLINENIWITEFSNFGNIIYLKDEINQIIERHK